MSDQIINAKLSEIVIGDRKRKTLHNIDVLAKSIEEQTLLTPIILTPDMQLVAGRRRMAAFELLKRTEIPARIVPVENLLDAEIDENVQREAFTVSDRVSIADSLLETIGERRGKKAQCIDLKEDQKPDAHPLLGEESRDYVAKRAGFGSSLSYRYAKTVVESAIPEVVEAMDRNIISINYANIISKAPKRKQLTLLNEAKTDPATAWGELQEMSKDRRKGKALKGHKIPDKKDIEPKYFCMYIALPWQTMSPDHMKEIPINDYAVFSGTTLLVECPSECLAEGIAVIKAWGYTLFNVSVRINSKAKHVVSTDFHQDIDLLLWVAAKAPTPMIGKVPGFIDSAAKAPWRSYFEEAFKKVYRATMFVEDKWSGWDKIETIATVKE